MKARRNILFALIPLLLLMVLGESAARLIVSSERVRRSLLGVTILDHEENRRALFDPGSFVVPDPYNGYRLRDPEDPASRRPPRVPGPARGPGEVRVVCLGDSTTYGYFLPEDRAWPARLQAHLNEWAPEGLRFEVYNCGVPGYGPQQCKRLLQSRYMRLEPDIVLWREEPDFADRLGLPEVLSAGQMRRVRLLYRSRLLYLLATLRHRAQDRREPGFHIYNVPPQTDEGYDLEALPALSRWCLRKGVRAFLGLEYLINRGDDASEAPMGYVAAAADRAVCGNAAKWRDWSLPYVPCLEAFLEYPGTPEDLFVDAFHLTEAGAELLARTVSDYLQANWTGIWSPTAAPDAVREDR